MAILFKITIMLVNCSKYATLCEKIAVLNTFWIFLVPCSVIFAAIHMNNNNKEGVNYE